MEVFSLFIFNFLCKFLKVTYFMIFELISKVSSAGLVRTKILQEHRLVRVFFTL
jgi:hypothetical protein